MHFTGGWLHVGRCRGADVRLHWSVPLLALIVGKFEFLPVFWVLCLGVVLVHEFGHAWMVRRVRCEVLSIDAHGFGGECAWQGDPSRLERAAIAWGGVLAQAALFVAAWLVEQLFHIPWNPVTEQVHGALLGWNAFVILFNLLPIRPLDGAEAWPIVPMLFTRLVERRRRPRAYRPSSFPPTVSRWAEPARKVIPFRDSAPTERDAADAARLMDEVRADVRQRRRSGGGAGDDEPTP